MKILITAKGPDWGDAVDPRFGRADYLFVYDDAEDRIEAIDNRSVADVAHGAGPKTAQAIAGLAPKVLITGNGPGGNAATALNRLDIEIYVGADGMTVKEAYEAYKAGKLDRFAS
jgi:predicted Fe-Mo cluster-binding NifX family protein